jgi:cytochrome P450
MEPFDLYSPLIDADPFPYYAELRAKYPCHWSDSAQLWILSRYHDIAEAARDWETFSSAQGNMIDELPGRAGATLGTTDPPRHDRLRALSQAAFLKRNLDRMIEPTLEIADRSLDRILEQGTFEFINDFSSQITVGLLFRTMGLPNCDHAEIRRKVILAVSTDKAAKGRTPEHIAAFKELSDFLTTEVAARRANPTDDLITHLAEAEIDGDRLTEREVVLTTATFVMAGVESLSSFMSVFALNLHDYPDARRRLVADPALVAPAIEESLRFNTSAQRFKRTATRNVVVHGQTIHAGDKVALAFGSPTATSANSRIRTRSTSSGGRSAISVLAPASISAWVRKWLGSSPKSPCGASSSACRIITSPSTRWCGIRRRISAARWRCRLRGVVSPTFSAGAAGRSCI